MIAGDLAVSSLMVLGRLLRNMLPPLQLRLEFMA